MIINYLSREDVDNLLPLRDPNTHKGDYGKILLLCGSRGCTGAAALAAMGALRTGAGVVYLVVPQSIYEIEAKKLLEPVILPVADDGGMYAQSAVKDVIGLLEKMDAVLIGPGIGICQGTRNMVHTVLRQAKCPVVLDADGINVISEHRYILRDRQAPTVITPHDGEFMRIGGQISADRTEEAAKLAAELGCIVLLKGNRTVITDGHGCYINTTGNPGMATGGSGDVLAGIIVSLIGQGIDPVKAAACGAWLHGTAGDICASEIGQYGMLPQDMIAVLPRLLP